MIWTRELGEIVDAEKEHANNAMSDCNNYPKCFARLTGAKTVDLNQLMVEEDVVTV